MTDTHSSAIPANERDARMLWSKVMEPGETPAIAVVEHLGAEASWEWMLDGGLRLSQSRPHDVPKQLIRCVGRWFERAKRVDLDQLNRYLDRSTAKVLIPGDQDWPNALDVLGTDRPVCLWLRGRADWHRTRSGAVSIVGARAATNYGVAVAHDLATELASGDTAIVSGGAFGIDIAAHRGADAVGGVTVAFLAGGIDSPYPRANESMLVRMSETRGAMISELGPGEKPLRSRFLRRNRLIAAASDVTVVVEAGMRSGAMSTARHAADLIRPLGAVPGPVSSRVSQGCHALIRDGLAVCVTSAADVLELSGTLGLSDAAARRDVVARASSGHDGVHTRTASDAVDARESNGCVGQPAAHGDGQSSEVLQSLFPQPLGPAPVQEEQSGFANNTATDLPAWLKSAITSLMPHLRVRRAKNLDELVMATGLAANTVLAALGELETQGRVAWRGRGWLSVKG